MSEWILGRNPVYEVLRAGRRRVDQLLVAIGAKEKGRLQDVLALSAAKKVSVSRVDRPRLDRLGDGHQGVALQVGEYPYTVLDDILALANARAEDAFLLILDALQDPQNLGTLLRSGEAVGIHGAVIPYRRTAAITPAVVSASSGACEHLLIAQANLAQSIDALKDAGVWVAGLEGGPQARLPGEIRLDGPLALVVGNEGQGMRTLVRSKCDFLLRLPMRGRVESLNAAVAGSIGLYLAWQARQFAGSPGRTHLNSLDGQSHTAP